MTLTLTPRTLLGGGLVLLLSGAARAQGPAFSSPGMPTLNSGQTDRFSRDFNPAISLAFDGLLDYQQFDAGDQSGGRLELRAAEALVGAWIDPTAWIYGTVATGGGQLAVEEASIQYLGFGDAYVLRAGRFFVDFGKQMQAHIHDLRTVERPLVLREYLGEELRGDGLQWDAWLPAGDTTILRYSLGVFQSLVGGGHDPGDPTSAEPVQPERHKLGEFNFTGRLTTLSDAGTNGQLQLGGSLRLIPELLFEDPGGGDVSSGKSNVVYGLDLTYGWVDDTATRSWTFGGEWLLADGALSGEVQGGAVSVYEDSASGFYAFIDHGFDLRDSAGLQYSRARLTRRDAGSAAEYDLYWSRMLSEFFRLRVALGYAERDTSPDSLRLALQLTGFAGPHDHGINW